MCVPPFRSATEYAYFNNHEIETAEGDLVPIGKVMFSRDGVGHAPTDPELTWQDVQRHYDDATCVGAFVHAGSDRFGTWIAGELAPGLNDLEVQHMRTHGPSGDWRPIKPTDMTSELVATIAVPIQGFQIARRALVASANGHITAIITAPLALTDSDRTHSRRRAKVMLGERLRSALGVREHTRAEMRRETGSAPSPPRSAGEWRRRGRPCRTAPSRSPTAPTGTTRGGRSAGRRRTGVRPSALTSTSAAARSAAQVTDARAEALEASAFGSPEGATAQTEAQGHDEAPSPPREAASQDGTAAAEPDPAGNAMTEEEVRAIIYEEIASLAGLALRRLQDENYTRSIEGNIAAMKAREVMGHFWGEVLAEYGGAAE